MKPYSVSGAKKMGRHWASLLALSAGACSLWAAETNSPSATVTNAPPAAATAAPAKPAEAPALTPEQMFEGGTNAYNNWIEFGGGGFFTSGNRAQFQQQQQANGGAFGGIEDFHLQQPLTNGVTLTLDGRAVVDENDYKARVDLTKEKLGYVRFSYDQFRTWDNADGGFYPPTGTYYGHGGSAFGLDRGDISFEAGLRLDNVPNITFKYDHTYREGQEGSTIWGITHPTADTGTVRGLGSSFYYIDEYADIFQLDATHQIKATEFGVGVRYETGRLTDSLDLTQNPNEPAQQKITDQQNTSYDSFNGHFFTETWIKKNLMLSSGGSYSYLNNDLYGSRVYGSDFDVGYVPALANGPGYFALNGNSQLNEYVADLNLFYKPSPHLSIVPSLRVQDTDANANANGLQTVGVTAPSPFDSTSDSNDLDVRERLDLTYTGITNWVLYARGELTEGSGNLSELGGESVSGPAPIARQTDDTRLFQKYSAGARWYATSRVTLDAGGYYKYNRYTYDNNFDSTPNDATSFNRYPAYILMQSFQTSDGNLRLTLRPRQNVSTVSRYEFQYSTIDMQPDPVSGLKGGETAKMTTHIVAQDINWTPWSRLYLQAGLNYVYSQTKTPASDYTASVLNAENNYWTVTFASGLVLDDRTDLRVAYVYYRADDYQDISLDGVPYGAGAEEHSVTATLTRRINKNIRWTLKYGFAHYTDELYGDNRNFNAHLLYTGLQYRF
jgi:hypothetical protein